MVEESYPLLTSFLKNLNIEIDEIKPKIHIKIFTNWCSPEEITSLWNKMRPEESSLILTTQEPIDYYVIINSPPKDAIYDKKRTIVFQMEPFMDRHNKWGEWSNPDKNEFYRVLRHVDGAYNNNEWHLSKTYLQLSNEPIVKTENTLSTVLSSKYTDIGHTKRIDFVKFLEKKGIPVHVFGDDKWRYKDYKGSLPYHCKDNAILPYKYTFNAENNEIPNYYTEKLIDGILGECLTFYWGCPNVRKYIDNRAYVQLELSNFEKDSETILTAIREDWHTQRLPFIKEAKKKILNELQFFPRLESIIKSKTL